MIAWRPRSWAAIDAADARLRRPEGAGVVTGSGLAVVLALVWFAHIGMDRALGLGLQYPDGSGRTHLGGTRRDDSGDGVWTG